MYFPAKTLEASKNKTFNKNMPANVILMWLVCESNQKNNIYGKS